MHKILEEIIAHKRIEVEKSKGSLPLSAIIDDRGEHPRYDFKAALSNASKVSIIAEIKKASPSKGVLMEEFDPASLARQYAVGGAAVISVLTDQRYFQGDGKYIALVKKNVSLPVLCKEFIIDPYQVYLARHWGADAVLLIAACLTGQNLMNLISLANELGLAALVEVHNRRELNEATLVGANIIGVNNRDLQTFKTDLTVSEELAPYIPSNVIRVAESGIFNRTDIQRLRKSGYTNFLIGESLVTAGDISVKLRELCDG